MRNKRSAALTRQYPASTEVKEQARDERRRMTEAERAVWAILRGHRVRDLKFLRKYALGWFVLDFYCPACLLAVEVIDGAIAEQTDLDRAKFTWLMEQGVDVLQLSQTEVQQDISAIKAQIEKACDRGGAWWYETEDEEQTVEEKIEPPPSIRGVFQHGAAFPLRPVAGLDGRPVIITFVDEERGT